MAKRLIKEHTRRLWLLPYSVVLLGAFSCKQNSQIASTKSLDNFTSRDPAKLTFNSCSGSQGVSAPNARLRGSPSEVGAIRTSLTAVPLELQDAFFKDLHGSIEIIKDIKTNCRVTASSDASPDDLLACWRNSGDGIVIYIKSESDEALTARNIRHSTVRMLGYVLTDVILKVKRSGGEAEMTENPALDNIKKDVAQALTSDTAKSKDYRIPASLKSNESKYNDAAFAEAFDSFYCSSASRSKMATNFPETHAIFTEIAAVLPQGLAGTLDTSGSASMARPNVASASNSGSFSLWGRWGWGNGPLRQGFRNWSNYRADGGGFMNFRRWSNGGRLFFR